MIIKSYAKLNLALDVLGRETNGYHKIQTIFYEYRNLYDELFIDFNHKSSDIILDCVHRDVPLGEFNSCYKAAKLLKDYAQIKQGIKIVIHKYIPVGSGLGGAASNAAAVLTGLNQIYKLGLTKAQLAGLGAGLGMDVPFFIYGGTALGTNFGEKIMPLEDLPEMNIKILCAAEKSYTREAYDNLGLEKCAQNMDKTRNMLDAIASKNALAIIENAHNDFDLLLENEAMDFAESSRNLIKQLKKEGAKNAMLSGSGSSVIGFF